MLENNNSQSNDLSAKPYMLDKPDSVSKSLVLNIFRRAVNPKQHKMFTFLEKFYSTSIKIGFLSIRLHSLHSSRLQKLKSTLIALQTRAVYFYFEFLLKSLTKHSEILKKSSQLEKILKGKQSKKLRNTSSDHLPEFAFNIIKRVIALIVYKKLFSTFTVIKTQNKLRSSIFPFKRLLCFSIRGTVRRNMKNVFDRVYLYSAQKDEKLKQIKKIFSVFLGNLGKVWVVLKYFERTPKYFLSNQWKFSYFNGNSGARSWKKSAIDSIFHIIGKKQACLMCYSLCKLNNFCINPWSSNISPMKLSTNSTDDSNMSIILKRIKLQDILNPEKPKVSSEKIKFSLLRLFETLKLRLITHKKQSFLVIRNLKKVKITAQRVSCKDLPICRKLNSSMKSLTPVNNFSLSPFRKYTIKK